MKYNHVREKWKCPQKYLSGHWLRRLSRRWADAPRRSSELMPLDLLNAAWGQNRGFPRETAAAGRAVPWPWRIARNPDRENLTIDKNYGRSLDAAARDRCAR